MSEEREPYAPKTDQELEQLAQDIVGGRVFHTMYHDVEKAGLSLHAVFMPLIFMESEWHDWIKTNDIGGFYEYMAKAGPRSCNGMPTFFSMKMMSVDDNKRLNARVQEIARLHRDRLQAAGTEGIL
jgi:hypothetical protein